MSTVTLPTPGTYAIDTAHTEVGFVARHLIGTKVRGRFTELEGTITIADPVEESTVTAQVATASINTGYGDPRRPPADERLPGRAQPPRRSRSRAPGSRCSPTPSGS